MANTRWVGTEEAARRMGITLRTLYRLADEGHIDMYKFGRVFRIKADDVDAAIAAAKVKPGTIGHLYPEPRGKSEP